MPAPLSAIQSCSSGAVNLHTEFACVQTSATCKESLFQLGALSRERFKIFLELPKTARSSQEFDSNTDFPIRMLHSKKLITDNMTRNTGPPTPVQNLTTRRKRRENQQGFEKRRKVGKSSESNCKMSVSFFQFSCFCRRASETIGRVLHTFAWSSKKTPVAALWFCHPTIGK